MVVKNQGVFLEREPVPYDQSHAPMPSCPVHMEETLVSVPRPSIGSVMLPKSHSTDSSITGWGTVMDGRFARGLWQAQHSSRHINGLEMLAVYKALRSFLPDLSGHHVLIRADNMSVVSYLNHQGGSEVAPSVQTGAPDPPVIQGETVVSQSDVCPRGPESGSRRPVEAGVEARGIETSPRGGEVDMQEVRPSGSGFVHVSRDDPLSTMVFAHASSPAGVGRHGTDVAEATPVCFSPDRSAPGSSGEGPERWVYCW